MAAHKLRMDDVYELFRRGTALLEAGHHHQATIPLTRARDLAPDKTSIREALGRALFGAQRYEQAAEEFEAVAEPGADQRLRAVLPRPLTAAARPPRRGAQASGAGRLPAAGPARLPPVPRPGARPRERQAPASSVGAAPARAASTRDHRRAVLHLSRQLSCRALPGGST